MNPWKGGISEGEAQLKDVLTTDSPPVISSKFRNKKAKAESEPARIGATKLVVLQGSIIWLGEVFWDVSETARFQDPENHLSKFILNHLSS